MLMRGWVGDGWVSGGSGWACGMRLGCVFCCCFCFYGGVVLVFCYGGSSVRQWWGGMWGVDGWVGGLAVAMGGCVRCGWVVCFVVVFVFLWWWFWCSAVLFLV